jgi:hypothetical protein
MYTAMRTGSVEYAVFVGGSNASQLSFAAAGLGLDVYKQTKGGWKLTKDSVDKLLPDLRDTLGSVSPDTPVVLFCFDNSCFFGLSDDGSMNPNPKCEEGDDGYHVKGALVDAPDKSLKYVCSAAAGPCHRSMWRASGLRNFAVAKIHQMPVLQRG